MARGSVCVNLPPRLACASLVAALLVAACRSIAPTALPGPSPTSVALSASTIAETPPDLASYAWDDRSPFRAGLASSQQAVLRALPGAPVYHIAITVTQSLDVLTGHEAVRYTNQTGAPLNPRWAPLGLAPHRTLDHPAFPLVPIE